MNILKEGTGEDAILMLHGRGSTAEDILTLSKFFNMSSYAFTSKNNQWYPLPFMFPKSQNEPYLSESLSLVRDAYTKLKESHNKVFILGFSQGACLALEYASKNYVDGVIAFSGGLIGESNELNVETKSNIFLSCSDNDPHIPLNRLMETIKIFKDNNSNLISFIYSNNSHTITSEEIQKSISFIANL